MRLNKKLQAEVVHFRVEKHQRPKKPKAKKEYVPNAARAVCNGKVATIHNGQRIVSIYTSGQPLKGKPLEHDAPPFTGFVRGWFRNKRDFNG